MERWRRGLAAVITSSVIVVGALAVGIGPVHAEPQTNPEFPAVACGGEWHWVHDRLPEEADSGSLTAVYEGGASRTVAGERAGDEIHYFDFIAGAARLLSAEDDVEGGRLRLVAWPFCGDRETTIPPETTTSTAVGPTTSTTTTGGASTTGPPSAVGSLSVVVTTSPEAAGAKFQIVIYRTEDPEPGWTAMLGDGEILAVEDLAPGAYTIEQMLPPPAGSLAWELAAASCDDGSDPRSVVVDAGEMVSCTFENRSVEVDPTSTVGLSTTTTRVAATQVTSRPPGTTTPSALPYTGPTTLVLGYLAAFFTALGAATVRSLRPRGRHERR